MESNFMNYGLNKHVRDLMYGDTCKFGMMHCMNLFAQWPKQRFGTDGDLYVTCMHDETCNMFAR